MKKLLALVLVIVLAVGVVAVFTGCDSGEKVVGLICLHGDASTYDKNFIDAFKAACEVKGLSKSQYTIVTDIPESTACYDTAADLADKGYKAIFADSFGHESHVLKAAKEFSDVQFYHATGTTAHTENVSNFHNAFASIYEGRYLAGVAAGLKLQEMIDNNEIEASNKDANGNIKLGYVGAFTYAEVISGFTSWYLGVKSVVSNVVMDVQFTGSWYDEKAEKTAAQTLIDNGCALISQHADSMGAPTACEDAGVPNVSYNGSTEAACPDTFIISSRINWQPYFEMIIDRALGKEVSISADWTGNINTNSVVVTSVGSAAAEGTQAVLDQVKAELLDGTRKVFDCSTFTVDGVHLTEYQADVNTDAAFAKDTQVIKKDGETYYFAESEFRSAPYFDINIDGITYLNTKF